MKKFILILILVICQLLGAMSFGKNKISQKKIEWACLKTLHFDIYYRAGEDEFGKIAALISEEAYYYLKKDFVRPIAYRIPIIFYSSHREFSQTNIIYPLLSEGIGGFTEHQKNRVVVPFDGSYVKLEKVLLHELTHAYVIAYSGGRGLGGVVGTSNRLPFWFSEGLPELESVGGKSVYNNMFIRDLVLNTRIPNLNGIGGYYAYRLGEKYLVWIEKKYGRPQVMAFFKAIKSGKNTDSACKQVFGKKFNEHQNLWHNALRREYSNDINKFDVPYEKYTRRTNHLENTSQSNLAPRISPLGDKFIYFSDKKIRTSVWLGYADKTIKHRRIIHGEANGDYEEFHFRRNNLAWLPDNQHFALATKTAVSDKIYIVDSENGNIVARHEFPQFKGIYELDVSPDGTKIVFAGQKGTLSDIYEYTLASKELHQLTNDRYHDYQPKYAPDGTKIAYCTERPAEQLPAEHVFYSLTKYIYYYDVVKEKHFQVTNAEYNCTNPSWSEDSESILYIGEAHNMHNVWVKNLATNQLAPVTNSLGGILDFDYGMYTKYASSDSLSPIVAKQAIFLSSFYEGGWDVYSQQVVLDSLEYQPASAVVAAKLNADLHTRFAIDRYQYYGPRDREFKEYPPRQRRPVLPDNHSQDVYISRNAKRDSLITLYNAELDAKPDSLNIPPVSTYRAKYSIDKLWGGMAYASGVGAIGYLQLGLSDLMGNKSIGIETRLSGDLQKSDLIVSYLQLAGRFDYGGGIFQINDYDEYDAFETISGIDYLKAELRRRERTFGIFGLTRWPFSKFSRLEFSASILGEYDYYDNWDREKEKWRTARTSKYYLFRPAIRFVFDNAINGSTGPVAGWKFSAGVTKSISSAPTTKVNIIDSLYLAISKNKSGHEYLTADLDLRSYFFFAQRYSLAARLVLASSVGPDPQVFKLDDTDAFRGSDGRMEAKNMAVASLELRFPLIDHLALSFPLPIQFGNVRGSAFIDLAALGDNPEDFKAVENGKFKDMRLAFGFGPRLNVGFAIAKVDIAWTSNLEKHGSPVYYFSLWQDF